MIEGAAMRRLPASFEAEQPVRSQHAACSPLCSMANVQREELWASLFPKNFDVLSNPASPRCRITCAPTATASCNELDHFGLGFENVSRRIVALAKVGPEG
jgi:hypothetical protein